LTGAALDQQWGGTLSETGPEVNDATSIVLDFSQQNSFNGWSGCYNICGYNLQMARKISDGWYCEKDGIWGLFSTGIWLKGKNKCSAQLSKGIGNNRCFFFFYGLNTTLGCYRFLCRHARLLWMVTLETTASRLGSTESVYDRKRLMCSFRTAYNCLSFWEYCWSLARAPLSQVVGRRARC
jgi:hypothetical protein